MVLRLQLVAGSRLGGEQQAPPSLKGGVTFVTIDVTVLDRATIRTN
jgi:hypothetical protein